jgi:hypothetical protein
MGFCSNDSIKKVCNQWDLRVCKVNLGMKTIKQVTIVVKQWWGVGEGEKQLDIDYDPNNNMLTCMKYVNDSINLNIYI